MTKLASPPPATARIVIVGGGITGLSAAHALATKAANNGAPLAPGGVVLLEKSGRFGGHIRSEMHEGFVIDGGPDSWVVNKPHASALARAVGLGPELVPTIEVNRRVYIAWNGALHPLPEGLVLAVPTRFGPMARTPLFSLQGKARMAMEPFIAAKPWDGDDDESVADFIVRRLGSECNERLAAPLLGGIFSGDASRISVRTAFPQFVDAERRYGSLIVAMRHERDARAAAAAADGKAANGGKGAPSAFVSLRGGMGRFVGGVAAAAQRAGVDLRPNVGVERIERVPFGGTGRYVVTTDAGETIAADALLLASPASVSARLLGGLDARAGELLGAVPFVSTATCFYAFRRDAIEHALDATGFLVPKPLGRRILAATWVSSKWEGRAPEGHVLMRAFFGGPAGEEALDRDDDELARIGLAELQDLMGLGATPLFTRVHRFVKASPQPLVGHQVRMRALRERLAAALPGLYVAGGGVDGIGIPDCIRQGEDAAAALLLAAPRST